MNFISKTCVVVNITGISQNLLLLIITSYKKSKMVKQYFSFPHWLSGAKFKSHELVTENSTQKKSLGKTTPYIP